MLRRKILYLICIIALLFLNILYFNYEFFIMLILALIIPLVSWALQLLAFIGMEINFYIGRAHVNEHDKISLNTYLYNSLHIPVARGKLTVQLQYSQDQNTQELKIPLGISESWGKQTPTTIKTSHCGILNIKAYKYSWYDYTGIYRSSKRMDGNQQVIVYPNILEMSELDKPLPKNKYESDMYHGIGDTGDEVTDYRKYEQGDPLNHVHWKLSTRSDEMIVKEYSVAQGMDYVILVDLSIIDEDDYRSHLDRIYQAAYSIGNAHIKQSKQCKFIVWNDNKKRVEEFEFSTKEILDQALSSLMKMKCCRNCLIKLVKGVQNGNYHLNDSVVLVTGQMCQDRFYQTYYVAEH